MTLNHEDHRKLAKQYATYAADHIADAVHHEALAMEYDTRYPQLAGEARAYAAHSLKAAESLRNIALQHEKLSR